MKTSSLTPIELGKKRIASKRLKIMDIRKSEGNFVNKENENPVLINNIKKNTFKKHDREVKLSQRNPFNIPYNMRTFISRKRAQKPKSTKPDPFIMSEPQAICDIDPSFYNIVTGRPIRPSSDIKVYMKNIRDITLSRADAAYIKESIVLLEAKLATEKAEYDQIMRLYLHCVQNFVTFIKESYKKVKKLQTEVDQINADLDNVTEELEACSINYVKLRNLVSSISYQFETRAIFARFLNSFAPDWWKKEYGTDVTNKNDLVSFDEFGNLGQASVSSLDEFKLLIAKRKKYPYLFFMEPKELMDIFETMSRQCLNYIQIDVQTSSVRNIFIKRRDLLKDDIAINIAEMEELIKIFEKDIKIYEEKEVEYKQLFHKVLLAEFHDVYASFDSAKLFTCVQYVNTKIIGNPEDRQDSIVTLMRQLENLYFSLTSSLDNLDQKFVKTTSKTLFAEDIKVMKRAIKAQKALKTRDITRKALYTSFEPPRRRQNIKTLPTLQCKQQLRIRI